MCRSYWITTWEGVPERLADIRQYLRHILGDVDGGDDVVLVASELAANAIRHSRSGSARGTFVLQVAAFTDCWHVRVDDQGGTSSPMLEEAKDTDESGRGLPMVAALARAWGTFGGSAGRTVWAEIPFPKIEEDPRSDEGDAVRVRGPMLVGSGEGVRWKDASDLQISAFRLESTAC